MDKLSEEFEKNKIEIDERKRGESLQAIRMAAAEKRIYYRPDFLHILAGQLRYMPVSSLVMQCVCGVGILLLLLCRMPDAGYVYSCGDLALMSAFSAFIGVFMVIEMNRNSACHMVEIEQSCYLNLKQLCVCKMIFFGGMELLILLGFLAVSGKKMEVGMVRLGIYILVPFLVSNMVYLFVFTRFRNLEKEYVQYILALLLGIAAILPAQFPKVYEAANLGIWVAVLLVAAAVLICEIYKMLKEMEEREECWN